MAFTAKRKEWCELYVFFQILSKGFVPRGRADGQADGDFRWPVALVQREEHDGTRRYVIEKETIRILSEQAEAKLFPREDFQTVAELVRQAVWNAPDEEIASPDGVEAFLDAVSIYNLDAVTDDRTDFYLAFWSVDAPLVGFRIHAPFSGMNVLLDGGRTANLKLEQVGVKFAVPTVRKINLLEAPNVVTERMFLIERLGGVLKYADVADKVFRSNLSMIDLHFPRMLTEMVRTMHQSGTVRVDELTESVEASNPLKIKEELISKHRFYSYKMKQFLLAVAQGMRPAKLYNGTASAVSGFVILDKEGKLCAYTQADGERFADYLYHNTRLLKGDLEKDKYGVLERENGSYYFKLNVKIGLVK